MTLVSIKKSYIELDLQLLMTRLESEGIKCYLKNDISAQVMSHIGGFATELQVAESDLERAREILMEMEGK